MKERIFAYYLPQFHPIPENDRWWGKGFTEWTNVGKAVPLFPGHYQPKVPSDLGYYDLRVEETRIAQAELAKQYGIEGFIYWHYWFGFGKQLLERPFLEVLKSGKPDFPFALAWANESWRGFAHGLSNERQVLINQEYGGIQDYTRHFYDVLPAFQDSRYIKIENKPLFIIYKPFDFPQVDTFITLWKRLAVENGLAGIYFVAVSTNPNGNQILLSKGFDGINTSRLFEFYNHRKPFFMALKTKWLKWFYKCPNLVYYKDASRYFLTDDDKLQNVFPTVCSNWDHTPRTGRNGIVFLDSKPELFESVLRKAKECIKNKDNDHSIIFIKSWNEWGEGNYLEPDLKYGHSFLKAISNIFDESRQD